MITNKHWTYVPQQTGGGGNPVGVIYIADEEELLDPERSAHERSLNTRERHHWRGVSLLPGHMNAPL